MNRHFVRRGLAATTLIGGLSSAGFIGAGHASASSQNTSSAPVAPATPPIGTLTQVNTGLRRPAGVSAFNGTVYMSNTSRNQVTAQNTQTGVSAPVAGLFTGVGESGDGGPATAATLTGPTGTAEDAAGNVYIADTHDNVVRKVDVSSGIITRFAGTGAAGHGGLGRATHAKLDEPQGVAVNAAGDVFVADTLNNRVDEVLPNGLIVAFAGNGKPGYRGDGHKAKGAELTEPTAVAVDAAGNVYIADASNNVVRRVAATTGVITTVAGDFAADQANDGLGGFSGDGGPATSAQLSDPQGVALDSAGDLFIADRLNNAIREVTPNGNIFTVVSQAGADGAIPIAGAETNGPATASKLNGPTAVAVDNSTGTLWIADTSNSRISQVTGLAHSGDAPGPVAR